MCQMVDVQSSVRHVAILKANLAIPSEIPGFTTNRSIDALLPPYWLFWLKTPRLKHLLAFVTQQGSDVKIPLGS